MAAPPTWGYLKSEVQAIPIEPGRTLRIGRNPRSDLVLKSRSVSSEHAEIDLDPNGRQAYLRDLDSLNGCFINNVRSPSKTSVGAAADWQHSKEGAAVCEMRKSRPPPQLPSGDQPNSSFFKPPNSPTALEQPAGITPWPPVEELRTSESQRMSEASDDGLCEEEPSGHPPAPEPWRVELAELQQKLKQMQQEHHEALRSARQHERDEAEQGWKAEAEALKQQLRELRSGIGSGGGSGIHGGGVSGDAVSGGVSFGGRVCGDDGVVSAVDSGGAVSATGPSACAPLVTDMSNRSPPQERPVMAASCPTPSNGPLLHGAAHPMAYMSGSSGGGPLASVDDGALAALEGVLVEMGNSVARLSDTLHAKLSTSRGNNSLRPPSPALHFFGGGGGGILAAASELLRRVQSCEVAAAQLTPARDVPSPGQWAPEVIDERTTTDRMKRMGRLIDLQQQRLSALQLRLGRRDAQVLALAGKDHGKALTLAEGEARAAEAEVRLKQREIDELKDSLLGLLSRSGAADGGVPPAEAQRLVAELTAEKARLKAQLERLMEGVRRAERSWSEQEEQSRRLAAEAEASRAQLDSARRMAQQAEERARRAQRAADEEVRRLDERVSAMARVGATEGARAKAAEFLVERLHVARERIAEQERRLSVQDDQLEELRHELRAEQALRAAVAPTSPTSKASQDLQLSQLHDQLRELQEVCRPELPQQQARLLRTLFNELQQQRQLVAQLEAALACGTDDRPREELHSQIDGGGGSVEEVLSQLLQGLQLKQLEEHVEGLSTTALAEVSGKEGGKAAQGMGVGRRRRNSNSFDLEQRACDSWAVGKCSEAFGGGKEGEVAAGVANLDERLSQLETQESQRHEELKELQQLGGRRASCDGQCRNIGCGLGTPASQISGTPAAHAPEADTATRRRSSAASVLTPVRQATRALDCNEVGAMGGKGSELSPGAPAAGQTEAN